MRRFKAFHSGPALVCAAWLAAALTAAPPAVAQSPAQAPAAAPAQAKAPPTPVSPLNVQAPSHALLGIAAREFIEAYGAPTKKLGLLARWTDPICVSVIGLVPEQGAQFRTRIETVAKAVKASVGGPRCTPNVEIVFTNQPQRVLEAAVARNPAILGDGGEKTVTRPIQAWYAYEDAGVPPRGVGPIDDALPPPNQAEWEKVKIHDRFVATRARISRRCVDPGVAAHNPRLVYPDYTTQNVPREVDIPQLVEDLPCLHSQFLNALIIVDVAHMGDVGVDLTSDYLALLALAQPKPLALDGCLALPSVLDLYAKDCPGRELPTALTSADRAYLTGLYTADVSQVQFSQGPMPDIAGRMVKVIETGKAPPP